MKPIIGVVSYPFYDRDGTGIFQINTNVVSWINKMGASPICILPTNVDDFYNKDKRLLNELDKESLIKLRNVLNMCDGIIKPGSYHFYPFQIESYRYTLETKTPYLGICQGLQLMSRTIDKDLPMESNKINTFHSNGYHDVYINRDTKLHDIIGEDEITVRSFHNYHVPKVNNDYLISAVSKYDGYIEAIEHKELPYNIGVQWHPEGEFACKDSERLFESFIEASNKYMKTKKLTK